MFVNGVAFLITISRNLKFGTVDHLPNRQVTTVAAKLTAVLNIYRQRGFTISRILADIEFEPLREQFTMLETSAADEHVADIERYIETVKGRTRSAYHTLPFRRIPRLIIEHLVRNSVFWLNAFPAVDGVSDDYSPRYIMTGQHVTYDRHVVTEFGAYVQTHEEHDNSMVQRTTGAFCLGPTGNSRGGHWFMSLTTGKRITRYN